MSIFRLAFGATLAAILVASPASGADGVKARSRVKISGSGSNVVLERSETPSGGPSRYSEWLAGPVAVALEMKEGGATDADVLAYLRKHAEELPAVIPATEIRKLKKAGAGREVIGYLSTVSAVDIGLTGEGREASYETAPPAQDFASASYGYPEYFPAYGYAGGYAPINPRPFRPGFHGRTFRNARPGTFASRPLAPRSFSRRTVGWPP